MVPRMTVIDSNFYKQDTSVQPLSVVPRVTRFHCIGIGWSAAELMENQYTTIIQYCITLELMKTE